MVAPRLAARLKGARGFCWLPGKDIRLSDIRSCLHGAALAMLSAAVEWDDTTQISLAEKAKVLEGVGRGFP